MLAKLRKLQGLAAPRVHQPTLFRRFADDGNAGDPDQPPSSLPNSSIVSKGFKYKYQNKTLSFVLDTPLFTYKNVQGTIGKKKLDLIKSMMLTNDQIFATAILPKNLEEIMPSHEHQTKDGTFIELNEMTLKNSEDVTNLFHSVSSYCLLELVDDSSISLRCLHKTRVNKVTQVILEDKDNRENVELKPIYEDLTRKKEAAVQPVGPADIERGELQFEDGTPVQISDIPPVPEEPPKEDESSPPPPKTTSRASAARTLNKLPIHDNLLHTSENSPLQYPAYNNLPVSTRVKIDYLADVVRNTVRDKYSEMVSVINYYDIDSFLDGIATMINDTRFFKYEEIAQLFAAETIEQACDLSIDLLKRFVLYQQKLEEVRRMAEQNQNHRRHREYYQEVYSIMKRMAEGDKKSTSAQLQEIFEQKNAPEHVQEIFKENILKLQNLDKNHSEYTTYKNYCDLIARLPWGVRSPESFDIEKARQILDKSHYGLEEVKSRILEFLAVGRLSGGLKGKILCLQGPPGVGKTSFALSVAEALNRKVFRISMGGEGDVAVLKGHRRTYIGSRPGKMVSALKECQTENCVIVIDEIDKVSSSNIHGDPQSTLLEILDPEQNNAFVDNYLDFPIDLSNVFFICTANDLAPISPPLLDRMDVINITSYTNQDKRHIFNDFLYKQIIEENGLKKYESQFDISKDVLDKLIDSYCRDPGIRSLQKYTSRMIETLVYELVVEQEKREKAQAQGQTLSPPEKILITGDNLHKYIGPENFDKDDLYAQMVPGVVRGLAYTSSGGSVLFIEASLGSVKKYSKGIKITGNLGDVMKESVRIAYTYARHYLMKMNISFLEDYFVHIHVPEGATPKDGPSAGIAITSAMLSLAMNRPLPAEVAMTGEVSLKGKVLKIGGVKEKLMGARREGVKTVLLPSENKEDVDHLKPDCKEGLTFHYVDHYDEVFKILFPEAAAQKPATLSDLPPPAPKADSESLAALTPAP